jgi:hypothetical protein
MSLRKAINAKCRDCICDPLDAGTAAQQIACCVDTNCPLHAVRPITATVIPVRLLESYHITTEQLDARARALVRVSPTAPESGQIGHIQSVEVVSGLRRLLGAESSGREGNEGI